MNRVNEATEWEEFEKQVESLLSRWREVNEAHPGNPARCIGACVAGINEIESVKRRAQYMKQFEKEETPGAIKY